MLAGGMAYGTIGENVKSLVGDTGVSKDVFIGGTGDIVDNFYATASLMMALIASGFAVSSALRPRSDEDEGRVEVLTATALPRARWWLGNVAVTVGGSVVVVAAVGFGMGVGFGFSTGDWGRVGQLLLAALVTVPAMLVLSGLARLLVGVRPGWAVLAWVGLIFCAVVLLFAAVLRLPDWVVDLSPFSHVGRFPADSVPWGTVGVVLLVAAALSAAGLAGFVRRDIRST